jgi:hypothetical protein
MKPTYFLPPDFISYAFESEADSGPIRLGQLISDINDPGQPVGSLEPLDPKSYDIEPRSIPGDNFSHIYEAQTSLSASLFLKAVQVIGLNFSIQVDKSDYSQLLSEIAGFEARSFEVKESYVRASMEQPSVQMWIKKGLFGKRVFMVTGILIAKPKDGRKSTISVSRENRSEQSGDLEASNAAAGQPGPAAVSGGAAAKKSQSLANSFSFVPKTPFVYGFRLRECFYRRGEVSSKAFTKGAKLHAESTCPEESSTSGDVGHFVFSGVADEDLRPDDLGGLSDAFQENSFRDEFEGEMCNLVIPKTQC